MSPRRLFIIDAMAMAFRNFHAFSQRPMTTSNGLPTSAVFGSAQFLLKLIEQERPDYLLIASDSKEPTFRHEMYPLYKANRSEMPADLVPQIPYLYNFFNALGVKLLRQPGLEADDLIASVIAQNRGPDLHCYIVSGDKDFMQIIDDHTFLYIPQKGGTSKIIGAQGVQEKFGCTPKQVTDILALIGDASDNVPGVFGIGEKGAAKLLTEYGSLENLYQNVSQIKNERLRDSLISQKDKAELSKVLVTLKADLALEHALDKFAFNCDTCLDSPDLLALFKELEFRSLTERLLTRLGAQAPAAIPTVTPEQTNWVRNYTLANTAPLIQSLCEQLAGAKVFAFDTETTGLNIAIDRPIGMSFSLREGEAFYVPLIEKHLDGIAPVGVLEKLRIAFAQNGAVKVAHNLKFDLQMLDNIGLEICGPFADSMIASHLLDPSGKSHGLDACSLRFLKLEKIPTTTLIGKKGEIPMFDVDLAQLSEYACEDADCTLRLHHMLTPKLAESGLLPVYETLEMPLVEVLARMEKRGIFVDAAILAEISVSLTGMEQKLEGEIYQHAGEEFNINSTKQLQNIIFEKLKLHEVLKLNKLKKTKSGFSTDVSTLERLTGHPLGDALLQYRSVTKLKNTYVDALPELINTQTNRIHTSFHQTGTATGRLSSSHPNLQNIPIRTSMGREIRRAFRAKDDDNVIVSADYSQIELRLLAHLAKEENLTEAFRRGDDIHALTAAKIFGCTVEEVTKEMRGQAKAINFGIIYGMGPNRLARETGVTMQVAKEFIEKYFATYPQIKTYIHRSIESARERGYTETITGRRRPLEAINGQDKMLRAMAENIAINSPIQGSAADLIKLAMIKIEKQFANQGIRSKMLLQVHDELVFECPSDEVDLVKGIIREEMSKALALDVPLVVDVGIGVNWLEAH